MAEAIDREAVEHGWNILNKRIEPDHIVIVVETWPNHSPQQTVHRFQSACKAVRPRQDKVFPGNGLWGKGYVVTTDLELLDELVAKLLEHQPSVTDIEQETP